MGTGLVAAAADNHLDLLPDLRGMVAADHVDVSPVSVPADLPGDGSGRAHRMVAGQSRFHVRHRRIRSARFHLRPPGPHCFNADQFSAPGAGHCAHGDQGGVAESNFTDLHRAAACPAADASVLAGSGFAVAAPGADVHQSQRRHDLRLLRVHDDRARLRHRLLRDP